MVVGKETNLGRRISRWFRGREKERQRIGVYTICFLLINGFPDVDSLTLLDFFQISRLELVDVHYTLQRCDRGEGYVGVDKWRTTVAPTRRAPHTQKHAIWAMLVSPGRRVWSLKPFQRLIRRPSTHEVKLFLRSDCGKATCEKLAEVG